MKSKIILPLFLALFALVSCDKSNDNLVLVKVATPEYMTIKEFRSSIGIVDPTPMVESGKIYVYGDIILVNDVDFGIHVIDNSNPKNPKKVAFIKVKANKDMEIKGDYLYVDNLMDLVVFDISNINNIKEVSRLEDVFPQYVVLPFFEDLVVDYGDREYNSDEILVSWKITEELRDIDEINNLNTRFDDVLALAEVNASTGQGGSLARFKIVDDFLYAVDSHSINVFSIDNLEKPQKLGSVFAGFDIETIFNRGAHLFLGSMRGMYIYDITLPSSPTFISEFQHGTACDPVVVDDRYAYITLRAGNFCGALDSSLQIVDITDLTNPKLTKSYAMDNPYGLGIKDDLLFICDGTSGLKVYDKSDVENIKMLNHFKDINTYDVIPMKDHLLMIGDNELFQYSYSNNGIEILSKFSLK